MDAMIIQGLISDLFFNHENEEFRGLCKMQPEYTADQLRAAIQKDSETFTKHYFDLFKQIPGVPWKDETEMAEWLHKDFRRRL